MIDNAPSYATNKLQVKKIHIFQNKRQRYDDQTLFSPHLCGSGDHRHGDLVADRMRCSSSAARPSQAEEAPPPSAQGASSSAPASASQILVMQGPRRLSGAFPSGRACTFSALLRWQNHNLQFNIPISLNIFFRHLQYGTKNGTIFQSVPLGEVIPFCRLCRHSPLNNAAILAAGHHRHHPSRHHRRHLRHRPNHHRHHRHHHRHPSHRRRPSLHQSTRLMNSLPREQTLHRRQGRPSVETTPLPKKAACGSWYPHRLQVETSHQRYGTSVTRIWLNFHRQSEGTKKGRPVSQASYPRLAGGFIHPTGGGRSCHGADFSGSPASFPFLQPVRPPMCAHTLTCRAYRQVSPTRKRPPGYPDGPQPWRRFP